jgi:hypothetical protein
MSMTMQQILDKTPRNRRDKADYVIISDTKKASTDYGTVIYKAKVYSTHDNKGNPKRRGQRIVYVTTVETNMKQTVVSCSCEDFMFTFEYALNKKKAARIEYCNGEPPIDRNPRMIPGCCGHIFKFGTALIAKGRVK